MANVAALFELYVLYQRTIIVKVVGTSTTKTFSFHNLSSFFLFQKMAACSAARTGGIGLVRLDRFLPIPWLG